MDRPLFVRGSISRRTWFEILGATASGILLASCEQSPRRTVQDAINEQLDEIVRSGIEGPHVLEHVVPHRQNPHIRPELIANIHTLEVWWMNRERLVTSRVTNPQDRAFIRRSDTDQSTIAFQFDPGKLIAKRAPSGTGAWEADKYPKAVRANPSFVEAGLVRATLDLSPSHYRKVFSY